MDLKTSPVDVFTEKRLEIQKIRGEIDSLQRQLSKAKNKSKSLEKKSSNWLPLAVRKARLKLKMAKVDYASFFDTKNKMNTSVDSLPETKRRAERLKIFDAEIAANLRLRDQFVQSLKVETDYVDLLSKKPRSRKQKIENIFSSKEWPQKESSLGGGSGDIDGNAIEVGSAFSDLKHFLNLIQVDKKDQEYGAYQMLFLMYKEQLARLPELERIIGYRFQNPRLLIQALMTGSTLNEFNQRIRRVSGFQSYQRLEFLGDRVLELATSDYLYHRFPTIAEGIMTMNKGAIVSNKELSISAEKIDIIKFLLWHKKSKPIKNNSKLTADLMEALFGAVYLDGGMPAASVVIERIHFKDAVQRRERHLKKTACA